jgi:hypothetical protein
MKKLLVSTTIALLLITVVVSATFAAPAAGRELLVKGSIQSLETYAVNFPIMSVTASGSGHASQLGTFTVSYSVQVNLLTNEGTGGVAEFVAANGDRLFAEGTGQATATDTPGVFNIVEHYTITGGTGRFDGASGNITLDRTVDITTGVTDGTMIGNIVLP